MVNKEKYSTPDSYDNYLVLSEHPVNKSIYLDIVNKFFQFLMSLVFDGNHVKLPLRTGSLYIEGYKTKPRVIDGKIIGLPPDWVGTKKLWESNPEAKEKKTLLYLFNEHTNGVRYSIKWSKKDIMTENKSLYSLCFTRANKRIVHEMITLGKEYHVKVKIN